MNIHRKNISTTVRLAAVMLVGIISGNAPAENSARDEKRSAAEPEPDSVDADRIETADDFNAFLDRCSLEEHVLLMQSMMGLGGAKLKRHHFEVGGTKVPTWFLGKDQRVFSVTAPPMSENLCRVGDDIFVVFESGAKKYRSESCPVDRLFRFRNKPLENGQTRQIGMKSP